MAPGRVRGWRHEVRAVYESADNVAAKAPAQFPAHKARYQDFHARGDLLLLGTFADPQRDGSMAIFATREAAEEFARGDPFVVTGVVRNWQVREWNEVLASPGRPRGWLDLPAGQARALGAALAAWADEHAAAAA